MNKTKKKKLNFRSTQMWLKKKVWKGIEKENIG